MTNKEYADFLLPNVEKSVEEYERMYPNRNLKEGAVVTRYAPSPTGFVHMGALFAAFIARKMAKQTEGVFFLRIEDTDKKREVENGTEGIIEDLKFFHMDIDEGMISSSDWIGSYGPYIQSKRKDIYQAYAKYLIEQDLAYPCFCTEEELEEIRTYQEQHKERIGYYGKWAKYRNLSREEVIEKVKAGEKYIIRIKSPGNFNKRIVFKDLVKGQIEFPENDMDIIIIKADGLPTYHFAHAVDDHLMHTTHVIRGDEWISSVPIHVQLFQMLGFQAPKYAHIAPLEKEEAGIRRKLSKRKDPEAAVTYYRQMGIPVCAVLTYLCTVANSHFEAWYDQNKDASLDDFKLEFHKISSSGSLFDVEKLLNISKNYISRLKADEVYAMALEYAKEFDQELETLLINHKDESIAMFHIEREQKKPRKDLACMRDVKEQMWYMYDELFDSYKREYEFQNIQNMEEIQLIVTNYLDQYFCLEDSKEEWFDKLKDLSQQLGYAREVKQYKENPDQYKGHVGDISMVLRVTFTTKSMTPDLYEIMKIFGKDRMQKRFEQMKFSCK